ncbi:hypothetical protein BU15DRAFT_62707 [Melanogaster broomeanus]|nr:hypothetical protein BU15DRAFT_62707 [Melanogaster broomeanus]
MVLNLQSILWSIQLSDYMAVLTFPKEVGDCHISLSLKLELNTCFTFEIDENKPWTRVSTMFVVIRYLGLPVAMVQAFGTATYLFMVWGYVYLYFCHPLFIKEYLLFYKCLAMATSNRFMKLLVQDSILYFIARLSIQERFLQGGWGYSQVSREHIDKGFGLASRRFSGRGRIPEEMDRDASAVVELSEVVVG